MTEFEILTWNQSHVLGRIYKLLLTYNTKTEQIKKCMTNMDANHKRIKRK